MKFRTFGLFAAAVAVMALSFSCKEKETTKEYMDGDLLFKGEMPSYVRAGDVYEFTVGGVTAPDGTKVGYYITEPVNGKKDTLDNNNLRFRLEIPDTLGYFFVSAAAYAVESSDKYYATYAYRYFTVVSDDPVKGSLSGISKRPGDVSVSVDGRYYSANKIGDQYWFNSNLAYIRRASDGSESFGHSFEDSPAMQNIFGAFYTWEEAKNACPDGWHLPTDREWVEMLKALGAPADLKPLETSPVGAGKLMAPVQFNGNNMWDYYRDVTIKDEAIGAIPAGYATISDGAYKFYGKNNYAVFWTIDEHEGMGVYRYIFAQKDNVYVATADKKAFAANVRCVKRMMRERWKQGEFPEKESSVLH